MHRGASPGEPRPIDSCCTGIRRRGWAYPPPRAVQVRRYTGASEGPSCGLAFGSGEGRAEFTFEVGKALETLSPPTPYSGRPIWSLQNVRSASPAVLPRGMSTKADFDAAFYEAPEYGAFLGVYPAAGGYLSTSVK